MVAVNSCLYRCRLMHERFTPKTHRFEYSMFMFYLDLDEVETVSNKLWLVSHNARNIYSLRDSDHLDEGEASVKTNLLHYLRGQGIETEDVQVSLLTMLRTFGHVFNPVSFYFVKDRLGTPLCTVAEVANTFKEQKLYLLRSDKYCDGLFRDRQRKFFYISPFSKLDMDLVFRLGVPNERLDITVNEHNHDGLLTFTSTLRGERVALTDRKLLGETLRFPFMTLQVVWGIHWHALKLWLKQTPYYKKRDNAEQQKELRPYLNPEHSSRS